MLWLVAKRLRGNLLKGNSREKEELETSTEMRSLGGLAKCYSWLSNYSKIVDIWIRLSRGSENICTG